MTTNIPVRGIIYISYFNCYSEQVIKLTKVDVANVITEEEIIGVVILSY